MSKKGRVKRPFNIDEILGPSESSRPGEMGRALEQAVKVAGKKRELEPKSTSTPPSAHAHAVEIPLFRLKENWDVQPRLGIDEAHVELLAQRFADSGQLTAILVRPLDETESEYEIIGGHHRYRAALQLGWKTIRCDIRRVTLEQAQLLALEDNDASLPTSDYERGRMYSRIMASSGISQGELARRIGVSRPRISQCLVFLELPPPVLEILNTNPHLLTYRHAMQLRDVFKEYGVTEDLTALAAQGLERVVNGSPAAGLHSWIKLKLTSQQKEDTPKAKNHRSVTDPSGHTAFTLRSRSAASLSVSWDGYFGVDALDVEQAVLKALQELVAKAAPSSNKESGNE